MNTITELERRVLELSYKNELTHIGSNLTAVRIIDAIYQSMGIDDRFVLSSGHAGLALYVVLEKFYKYDAQKLLDKHGTHPNRDEDHKIWVSSGSLGHGLGIAMGMAIAKPDKTVHCLISDGECAEGSVWEAIRVGAERQVDNIVIYVNANGYGAYSEYTKEEIDRLEWKLQSAMVGMNPKISFMRTIHKFPPIEGLQAHYHKLTEKEYNDILDIHWKDRGNGITKIVTSGSEVEI